MFHVGGACQQPQPPSFVNLWERTLFTTLELPVGTVANPFADVKLKAEFMHAQGVYTVPVVCTGVSPNLSFPVFFAPPHIGPWTWFVTEEVASGGTPAFGLPEVAYQFTCIASDRTWSSCIGLQRGGEIGLASIYGSVSELYQHVPSWASPPSVEGHRDLLAMPGRIPCPIFVEEDWVVDNVIFPWRRPAGTFDHLDNPYCVRPTHMLDLSGVLPVPNPTYANGNPYKLPGLTTNQEGIEKWCLDYAWGASVVGGAMIAYWGPRYADLSEPYNLFEPIASVEPLKAAHRFMSAIDWWNFAPDPTLVSSQSPPVPARLFQGAVDPGTIGSQQAALWATTSPPLGPSSATRAIQLPAIEAAIVAARSTAQPAARAIVYSPFPGSRATATQPEIIGPATAVLNLTGFPETCTYRFLNPVTLEKSPLESIRLSSFSSPSQVAIQPPFTGSPYLGPNNEYVLLINVNYGGGT